MGSYLIKKHKYDVVLTIKAIRDSTIFYTSECKIFIDDNYSISQTFQYHGRLNEESRSPEEWQNGEWIEFVGSAWTNLSNNKLSEYWLNAYAINKHVENNRLEVKIWDNVNKKKEKVYFNKIESK